MNIFKKVININKTKKKEYNKENNDTENKIEEKITNINDNLFIPDFNFNIINEKIEYDSEIYQNCDKHNNFKLTNLIYKNNDNILERACFKCIKEESYNKNISIKVDTISDKLLELNNFIKDTNSTNFEIYEKIKYYLDKLEKNEIWNNTIRNIVEIKDNLKETIENYFWDLIEKISQKYFIDNKTKLFEKDLNKLFENCKLLNEGLNKDYNLILKNQFTEIIERYHNDKLKENISNKLRNLKNELNKLSIPQTYNINYPKCYQKNWLDYLNNNFSWENPQEKIIEIIKNDNKNDLNINNEYKRLINENILDKFLYIFKENDKKLLIYNIELNNWQNIDIFCKNNIPYNHSIILTPDKKLLLMGGELKNEYKSECFNFNFNRKNLKLLNYFNIERSCFTTIVFQNNVYIFGGKNKDGNLNIPEFLSLVDFKEWQILPENKVKEEYPNVINFNDKFIICFTKLDNNDLIEYYDPNLKFWKEIRINKQNLLNQFNFINKNPIIKTFDENKILFLGGSNYEDNNKGFRNIYEVELIKVENNNFELNYINDDLDKSDSNNYSITYKKLKDLNLNIISRNNKSIYYNDELYILNDSTTDLDEILKFSNNKAFKVI